MQLALVVLATIASSVLAGGNPEAERSFLGGNVDMALIRSGKQLPFTPVPFRKDGSASSRMPAVTAEALKARFASLHKRAALRANAASHAQAGKASRVLAPRIAAEAQLVQVGARSPRLATMKGDSLEDNPMTTVMMDTITSMTRSMDFEQMRLYGCSPGAQFGHPLLISAPKDQGFPRDRMVTLLRDLYDLSVVPSSCCTKRVRLGDGMYLPLTEFLAVMIRQMRDADGGAMRVDLQSTFPPAFDFLCSGIAGSPDSVITPQYHLKGGAQIGGVLRRIDNALSGLLDVCTGKDTGDPIAGWLSNTNALRQFACEAASIA